MHNDLTTLLATLRAVHWHSWNAHWNSTGPQFFADHQLFERIYAGEPKIIDQTDGLAERMVGLGFTVDEFQVDRRAGDILAEVKGVSPIEGALVLEKLFVKTAGRALPKLSGYSGKAVTLDNYLRTLVDDRSTVTYLLQQRLAAPGGYGDLGGFVGAAVGGGLTSILLSAAVGVAVGHVASKYGDKIGLPHWQMKPAMAKGALIGGGLGMLSFVSGFTRGTAQAASMTAMIEAAKK